MGMPLQVRTSLLKLMTTPYSRLDVDSYFLQMAQLVAQRSTCRRRSVGCVLVDSNNHVVATGYNGVPTHFPHCLDYPCVGADSPSGTNLEQCLAVHAEQNALLQLRSNDRLTAYLTVSPCTTCAKMIANSKIIRIVAQESYTHAMAFSILKRANIKYDYRNQSDL